MKKLSLTSLLLFITYCCFAQQWSGTTDIYNTNSGNVGIGITTPLTKLHILKPYSALTSVPMQEWDPSATGYNLILSNYNSASGIDYRFTQLHNNIAMPVLTFSAGNVGIGTTSPSSILHINGTTTPSASGTVVLTVQAAHTSGTLGSGGIIKFTNNIATADAASIRTYTDGAGAVSLRFQTGYGTGTLADRMTINNAGDVSIGTTDSKGYLFAVNGTAIATAMTVKLNANWPDYVFKPQYQLPALSEVKTYIDQNQHLPDMPSEAEVKKEGINLGEMNTLLTKKVEELTLYLIEQHKIQQQQQEEITQLKEQMKLLLKAPR